MVLLFNSCKNDIDFNEFKGTATIVFHEGKYMMSEARYLVATNISSNTASS